MTRNSSFELLRLILMMMIIIHHCIVHGMGLTSFDPEWDSTLIIPNRWVFPACFSNCFCICAVNCFVLISGYWGIKTNSKKIKFLLFALIFYTIFFNFIPNIVWGNYIIACKELLLISHSPYWFVVDYLFLMAFTPIFNLAFEKLKKKQFDYFVLAILIISCYFGFIWGNSANVNGYTLLQFILMYCIGRIIYRTEVSIKRIYTFSGYIITSALCGMLMWILWNYGFTQFAWRITYYNNPLIILSSIFLFLIFKDITIKSNEINSWAKSAFGIYLIQSSHLVGHFLYPWIRSIAIEYQDLKNGGILLILIILCTSLLICILSIIIDKVRLFLSKQYI